MTSSFRLFRFRGIDVGAHWSWVIVFVVIVSTLSTGFFPDNYEGLSDSTYWTMGIATGVLFVVSLLLHELGHAVRAQREGMEIDGITLWIFGGVARFKGMFPSAGAEFRIAVAGPIVTVVLLGLFWGLWFAADAGGAPEVATGVLDYLWQINLTLLVFNMLPALPLDGGRVLRSSFWMRSGNFTQATVSAGRVARVLAGGIIAVGALLFFGGNAGGLWIAFIGWFILQAAQAEVAYAMFRQSLRGMSVADVMSPGPQVVDPDVTIASFIDEFAHTGRHSTYPVVGWSGELEGLMSLRRAAQVPVGERPLTRIRDVMLGRDETPALSRNDDIAVAVASMQEGPGRGVVVENGRVVGVVSMADVARALELESVRSGPGERPRRRRLVWVIVGVALLGAVAYLYSPPFVIFAPGKAFDVTDDIRIRGVDADDVDGEYLLTSVAVQQPNVLGVVAALFQGRELAPLQSIVPADVDPEEYFEQQEALFKEAQTIAAAAAAQAAGMKVDLNGDGARIEAVSDGSPAERVLEAGDVVVAIDGKPIELADDLQRTIRARPVGTTFTFEIERGKDTRTVEVESRSGIVRGAPGIGVLVATENFDVNLPFKITFEERDIGGPSAGLSYALAVYDLIEDSDLAAGRVIATTGTMDLEGNVGPIGGVEQKTVAATRQGAELFLVPSDELDQVPSSDLEVVGVETLEEAIEALRNGS